VTAETDALRNEEAAREETAAAAVHGVAVAVEPVGPEITAAGGWCVPSAAVEAHAARRAAADDLGEEETPEWGRDDRGLTYRELLVLAVDALRFAPTDVLDRPVRVDLGDTIDGIQSIVFDPDAGRMVVYPWLTRGVPRVSLPAPGLDDFLIREPAEAGAALRVIRLRREIDRKVISHMTGVAPSTIGNIERGIDTPSAAMLIKLSQAMSVGVEVRDDADDKTERPDFSLSHASQVGPMLRVLRFRRGIGVGVVALAANVSQRILRQYEDGATAPNLPTLIRLLDVLDAVLALSDLDRREPVR